MMNTIQRNFNLALLLLLCLPFAAQSAGTARDPYAYFFHDTFGDYAEELEEAKAQNKKAIMIFFEMDECPFCHRMKTTIMNRPDVQEHFREHFLIFAHDIEGDLEIVDFQGNETTQKEYARMQRVRATPVFTFFDLQGKRIERYIGATADAEEFKWLADFVAQGHYKNTNFTRYKRARREAEQGG